MVRRNRSFHFYAYPLTKYALDSILSDLMCCESLVRSLTQISDLHTISIVKAPIPSLLPGDVFHFKGHQEDSTIGFAHFYNHVVPRMFKWEETTASHQTQRILSDYQKQPETEEDQKTVHVHVTFLDSDWKKLFRLAEMYEGTPYFFIEDLPEMGSKNGRSIVYFVPAFDQKKLPYWQDQTFWIQASSQEKWMCFLKHGYMHLDVPLPLRSTLFATVFERLALESWRFDKINGYINELMCKRNSFCDTPEELERGEVKRAFSPLFLKNTIILFGRRNIQRGCNVL